MLRHEASPGNEIDMPRRPLFIKLKLSIILTSSLIANHSLLTCFSYRINIAVDSSTSLVYRGSKVSVFQESKAHAKHHGSQSRNGIPLYKQPSSKSFSEKSLRNEVVVI